MMELVELSALTERDWADLTGSEHEPFGAVGAGLAWREKDRNVALRAGDGHLIAAAGAVIAEIQVEDAGSFEVVGVGGVIVTASARGRGLMSRILDPLLALAEGMGPERAMLFCRPELVAVYRSFGFAEITAPVCAYQQQGRVEMPMPAMWRALHEGAEWPPGRVDVAGLPF